MSFKTTIKSLVPLQIKEYSYRIRNFTYEKEINKNIYDKTKKKIYLIGTPGHGNVGDLAIALAEIKFIKDNFPLHAIVDIPDPLFTQYVNKIKRYISHEDIIILHGGGNLGVQYLEPEYQRRIIMENFPNNKIILFPQTLYFEKSDFGNDELEKTRRIYNSHKNLTLISREQLSYRLMKETFQSNNVILTPDIVFYLNETDTQIKREGVSCFLRNDKESKLTLEQRQKIINISGNFFEKTNVSDMTIGKSVLPSERERVVNDKLEEFKKSEFVITDRIHGMVFAAITSTPCIALSNYNHKVKETYKWISNLGYIKFAENIDDIQWLLEEFNTNGNYSYDNKFTEPYYQEIVKLIN